MASTVKPARLAYIGSLVPGVKNIRLVCVIIAKHESRKTIKKDGSIVYVANMTIRDSAEDYVNVSFWVSEAFSKHLDDEYHIGDVIEITNPRVAFKGNSVEKKFSSYGPETSVNVQLSFSEDSSMLSKHQPNDEVEAAHFSSLLQVPTKSDKNFWTLLDLHNSFTKATANVSFVDVLVCVRSIGPVKRFKPKTVSNEPVEVFREFREITVFDRTHALTTIKLWDFDWIHLAEDWIPKKTILFFSDVRVDWDSFRNCPILTAAQKTIISFNPALHESKMLAKYATTIDFSWNNKLESLSQAINTRSITKVSTIIGLQRSVGGDSRIERHSQPVSTEDGLISTVVYGFITWLNINEDISRFIQYRCTHCNFQVPRKGTPQDSKCCPSPTVEPSYDIRINISDFTGSLLRCKLLRSAAEVMFGPASEMVKKSSSERDCIREMFLLDYVKLCLLVVSPTSENRLCSVVVLNCQKISIKDLANNCPIPPVR